MSFLNAIGFTNTLNKNIVVAVARRDLRSYFMNPSGYVFLTVFILLSATAAFWSEEFFANNLANLDMLNAYFPYLLLFFIPALTMSVWADERRQGTDELLLTLPATDSEVTLGKYFAILGVYTASLVISFSHVFILSWLGDPDLGLMIGNYIGYWLIGAALLSVGMLASLLTSNATVAFVLGALFCALLVFFDSPTLAFSETLRGVLAPLGVFEYFNDFARGVISLTSVLYFLSIIGIALYLNVIVLGRRHWRSQVEGFSMKAHHLLRAVALVVAVISANAIVSHASFRIDVTSEGLHSLSDKTVDLLAELPDDRPVFIQAFISPEVPRDLVETKANLIGFLKEIDASAGSNVQVIVYETEPYSSEARDARDKFNITPRGVFDQQSPGAGAVPVYLGVAFTCGSREDVIPFFERGLPVEYTLTRSIRTVASLAKKKIGVVITDMNVFGGFDFQTFSSTPPWSVVAELRKQYEVIQVNPEQPISNELDGLICILPSALPQPSLDNLLAYVMAGNPTMLIDDPMPTIELARSPAVPPDANSNPFNRQQQQPKPPKGNIEVFFATLGVQWNKLEVFWDQYNPHPNLAHLPQEIVFIGQNSGATEPFNQSHPATAGLQEMVLLYPGLLRKGDFPNVEFIPLITSNKNSGMLNFHTLVQRNFFGMNLNRNPRRLMDALSYTPAAHIKGVVDTVTTDAPAINMIVIADIDFISEQFFQIRNMGAENLNFDNITFFLNCIDVLVGDESFIELRKKRVKHRTLETVEEQTREFYATRIDEEAIAEENAKAALTEAQGRLDAKVAEVRKRIDLDEQTKKIMTKNLQEAENRRFEVTRASIEAERDAQIQRSKENMELSIRSIQSGIKTLAVALPPTPALIFGIIIFLRRRKREREGMNEARRLRS